MRSYCTWPDTVLYYYSAFTPRVLHFSAFHIFTVIEPIINCIVIPANGPLINTKLIIFHLFLLLHPLFEFLLQHLDMRYIYMPCKNERSFQSFMGYLSCFSLYFSIMAYTSFNRKAQVKVEGRAENKSASIMATGTIWQADHTPDGLHKSSC